MEPYQIILIAVAATVFAAAVLVFIVPGVNILVFLMLLALPGKAGANRFGPDPVVLKSISIEEWRRMRCGGDADAR